MSKMISLITARISSYKLERRLLIIYASGLQIAIKKLKLISALIYIALLFDFTMSLYFI